MVVLVRGRGDLASAARGAVRRSDPQLPLTAVGSLAARVEEGLFRPRLLRQVLGLFAAAALLLTALGLYGTLAGGVTRRRFELGVRLALGARPGDLVAMVVRRALAWTVAGLVLAVPLAMAFQGWLGARVAGVQPWSWPTLAVLVVLIVTMAVAAAWLPASRVRRIDPAEALTGE
jgi:ABC-type antimicrobial peptide transport system permease subunit